MLLLGLNDRLWRLACALLLVYVCWKLYTVLRLYGDANVKKHEKELLHMIQDIQNRRFPTTQPVVARLKYVEELILKLTIFLRGGNSTALSDLILQYSLQINMFIDEHIMQDGNSSQRELQAANEMEERLSAINLVYRDMSTRKS